MARVLCNTQAWEARRYLLVAPASVTKTPPPRDHLWGGSHSHAPLCWEASVGLTTRPAGKGLPENTTSAGPVLGFGDFLGPHGDGFLPAPLKAEPPRSRPSASCPGLGGRPPPTQAYHGPCTGVPLLPLQPWGVGGSQWTSRP